ncbi:MAG: hypothetical protein EB119_09415 [Synechococcaceae bacterium WBB_34_004]|nr:hypothetical protein [Synechococcaceae bacterium WBB_34_004]
MLLVVEVVVLVQELVEEVLVDIELAHLRQLLDKLIQSQLVVEELVVHQTLPHMMVQEEEPAHLDQYHLQVVVEEL